MDPSRDDGDLLNLTTEQLIARVQATRDQQALALVVVRVLPEVKAFVARRGGRYWPAAGPEDAGQNGLLCVHAERPGALDVSPVSV